MTVLFLDGAAQMSGVPPCPLVSVVIPAYNAELTLAETANSVLCQPPDPAWELIIVDDGSTDSTLAVADSIAAASEVVTVLHQSNSGRGAALNLGLSLARGRWLLPLDADDLLEPYALARQVAFISAHAGYQLYSWGHSLLRQDGSRVDVRHPITDVVHEVTLEAAARNSEPRMVGTMFIESDMVRCLGGYRDFYVEDLDLVIRAVAAGGRWLHNPEILHRYRIRPESKSRSVVLQTQGRLEVYRAIESESKIGSQIWRLAREERVALERAASLTAFRRALDCGDWSQARHTFPRAFRHLGAKPHWWLFGLLVYLAPGLLRRVLVHQDRAPG